MSEPLTKVCKVCKIEKDIDWILKKGGKLKILLMNILT